MWKEIQTEDDITALLSAFGQFHDSCLRDIYISTREYVDERLAMHFENKNVATLLFQKQNVTNSVLELKFKDLDRLNFYPLGEEYYGVIYEATFKKIENLIYWSDEPEWKIGDNEANWISAKKVYWRYRPDLLGNVSRLK